jgi:hypothetical protein
MNDGHQRFQEWLTAGAEGDPPRDAAVHASVCDSCRQSTAALDQLAAVDPGRAPFPTASPVGTREELAHGARLAGVAVAVLFGAVILGVGTSQLIGLTRGIGPIAQASRTPGQGVLGATATAQASAAGGSLSPGQSPDASGPASPTKRPISGATARPRRSARPTATQRATSSSGPTPGGTPTGIPTPTVAATPTASPTPTPVPTPIPTPGAPFLDVPTWNGSAVHLSWNVPAGGPINNYEVWRSETSGSDYGLVASPTTTSYDDSSVVSSTTYYYIVRGVGDGGTGSDSNEVSIFVP